MSAPGRCVYLHGTGHYVPDRVVDNIELYELPGIRAGFDADRARASLRKIEPDAADRLSDAEVFDQWARQLTGIGSRRLLEDSDDISVEDMCAFASTRALDHAQLSASDLELIVVASLTAREVVPNAAVTLADRIGVPSVPGFVLNTACAGFIHALSIGYAYIASGTADEVLVVAGDALSRITNYGDPKTAVLFADGAGAALLSSRPGPGRLLACPHTAAEYSPDHLNLMGQGWGPPNGAGHKLSMAGGPNVLRHAIRTMREASERTLTAAGVDWDDVDVVIPHQANERITVGLERSLRLKKGRVLHAIDGLGNVSASTVPITLDRLLRGEHGSLPEASTIVLTAVGGGYASGAAALRWGEVQPT